MNERGSTDKSDQRRFHFRIGIIGLAVCVSLTAMPTVSAHNASAVPDVLQWYGLVALLGGVGLMVGSVYLRRTHTIQPTNALLGVFVGLVLSALGGVGFTELSPEPFYTASSIPFPRAWYQPIALGLGFAVISGSFLIGRFRWPACPRYTFLGIELGLWVAYPALIPDGVEYTHPLGYLLALSVPLTVGYIIWKDCLPTVRLVLRDRAARWFGTGVGLVVVLFFMFATGFLSFLPEEGVGVPTERTIAVLPTLFPLVTWPTIEWWFPSIPFVGMISVGVILVVGMLGVLIGLNAAIVARLWTSQASSNLNQGTAGTATFIGSNACSCCGPLIAKFIIIAVGPSAAAPLYWLFVDLASPAGTLFLTVSILLLTASLVRSVNRISRTSACQLDDRASDVCVAAD